MKRPSVEKRRRAVARTLREIQSSPELAERLDCGDFSTAFVRTGNIHHSGLSARPTAPLKPAHSKRWREIPVTPLQTSGNRNHLCLFPNPKLAEDGVGKSFVAV
jgi:hypothetical protein